MRKYIIQLSNYIIEYSFYFLFFLVPLILTTVNYELFEYNKMMLTYGLTVITTAAWLTKMVIEKKFIFKRSFLGIPLFLFLLSQIISTIFSIDRHTSLWGYYSRFHGGLASTIAYLLLFFAFVTNFPREKIGKLLTITLLSAVLVSLYGIAEHFGIDAKYWVQDVQNRVFSTLGQPNWLAAYLAVIIPISIGIWLNHIPDLTLGLKNKTQISKLKSPAFAKATAGRQNYNLKLKNREIEGFLLLVLCSLFYVTLLFTKSRSGFIGFWIANSIFWTLLFTRYKKFLLKLFLILNSSFLILNFLIGVPVEKLNKISLGNIVKQKEYVTQNQTIKPKAPSLDTGITESSEIRRIVWRGAIEVAKYHPIIGTGVETFAFSYYRYRPIEHNLTSEWDFLYNKAHNEYLNILATTGILGLGTYLILIGTFIFWTAKQLRNKGILNSKFLILNSFFAAWLSILITNFFGFSVVPIAIFFFLIPALSLVLEKKSPPSTKTVINIKQKEESLKSWQKASIAIISVFTIFIEFKLLRAWLADYLFAKGYNLSRINNYSEAYPYLQNAVRLNSGTPIYHDELSYATAVLSTYVYGEKEATLAARLASEAVRENQIALKISPNNVNYWKTATRIYFELTKINDSYLKDAIMAIQQAQDLAPTDAKIIYNLGILYGRIGKDDLAIETLKKAIKVKPNYKEARFALAIFYEEIDQLEKAREELVTILQKIDPEDKEIEKKYNEVQQKINKNL